jgi:hypothetical protein
MEPIHHPEWAYPLTVGEHTREFLSALPEKPTKEVLSALARDRRLVAILSSHPLGRLELSGRIPNPTWNGSYRPASGDLVVNPFRPPESYGKEFHPGVLKSVSEAGRTLTEAIERSLYHELGHHVLYAAGPGAERQLKNLFRSGRATPVSIRARKDAVEYFSESFSAYRFEDSFADRDPEGYHMVEAILGLVGKK